MNNNPTCIAPNNQFPATHFIEVWKSSTGRLFYSKTNLNIKQFNTITGVTKAEGHKTIAIFKIRPNRVPCKHIDSTASVYLP